MNGKKTNFDSEISYLIAQYIADVITPEENSKLEDWLSDADNRKVFERIVSPEVMSGKISNYRNENVSNAFESFLLRRAKITRRKVRFRWCAAAAVIIPLLTVSIFLLKENTGNLPALQYSLITELDNPTLTLSDSKKIALCDVGNIVKEKAGVSIPVIDGGILNYSAINHSAKRQLYNLLEIPASFDYHFILSDGTKVWMNAMSSLRYPVSFNKHERVVEASGEVYFEVMPDPKRPFYVTTKGMKVEVTGTSFNVCSYPDEAYSEVTLAEGKVRIQVAGSHYNLTPGRQLHWEHDNQKPEVRQVNVDEYTSWKDGMYIFKSSLLGDVMKVVKRWYDIEIIFENPDAAKSVYTGVMIKEESLEAFLSRLEETSPYKFKYDGVKVKIF